MIMAYDASYMVLADSLECALVTADDSGPWSSVLHHRRAGVTAATSAARARAGDQDVGAVLLNPDAGTGHLVPVGEVTRPASVPSNSSHGPSPIGLESHHPPNLNF